LYVFGIAVQSLRFEDFIRAQETIVEEWRVGKITDEELEVLVFRPMVFSRRMMLLHKNPLVVKLVDKIRREVVRRDADIAFNQEFFKKLESGYYRRYALSHKDQFDVIDDEQIVNYGFFDKSREMFLQGYLPLFMLSVASIYLAIFARRRNKKASLVTLFFVSGASALSAALFYLGIIVV
jgi:hypothetical protein